ncbi:hypothetical protein [Rhodococcus sp. NPDC049939]|uniref:hypothetical protein n=1 Tax=Rhodococcus sp. NPDC049939 TaxID=3155511 RepID=UPI0033DB3795
MSLGPSDRTQSTLYVLGELDEISSEIIVLIHLVLDLSPHLRNGIHATSAAYIPT